MVQVLLPVKECLSNPKGGDNVYTVITLKEQESSQVAMMSCVCERKKEL